MTVLQERSDVGILSKSAGAQKRGGGKTIISIDEHSVELRYQYEPMKCMTPDTVFGREWAFTVLDQVTERLRQRYTARRRGKLFEEPEACLGGSRRPVSHAETAVRLGIVN
jgi:hypothetical protein